MCIDRTTAASVDMPSGNGEEVSTATACENSQVNKFCQELHQAITSCTLTDDLTARLQDAGYVCGIVEPHHMWNAMTGRSRTALKVVHDGIPYMMDSRQRHNIPRVGEMVLFRPDDSYQLTSTVMAVHFTPVRGE